MTEYESTKWGYMPHDNQTRAVCPNCGCGTFVSYAQAVNVDAEVWCWEHECTRCGHLLGIEVKRK